MHVSTTRRLFCATVIVSALSLSAAGQDLDNVTITGKVADQNGAVIPGATITVTTENTKFTRSTVTDTGGNYQILQIAPGKYNLRASAATFQPTIVPGLEFSAGRNAQIDLTLLPPGLIV